MTDVRTPDDGDGSILSVDVGGYIQAKYLKPAEKIQEIFDNVKKVECRDDDVLLCTFPKNGTNWVFELINMVMTKSATRVQIDKMNVMLDCIAREDLNKIPSPRVLNTHYPPRYLPIDELRAKQVKTVLVVRNPKDTASSFYLHMCGIKVYGYDGQWDDWIWPFMEGRFEYGNQMAYLNEWQDLIESDPGLSIHVVYYEDLKRNGMAEFERLAKFLHVELDDQLKQDIFDNCHIDKMKHDKEIHYAEGKFFQHGYSFFRKGEIGDWTTRFTAVQNKRFDDIWNREIRKDTMFKFQYK